MKKAETIRWRGSGHSLDSVHLGDWRVSYSSKLRYFHLPCDHKPYPLDDLRYLPVCWHCKTKLPEQMQLLFLLQRLA